MRITWRLNTSTDAIGQELAASPGGKPGRSKMRGLFFIPALPDIAEAGEKARHPAFWKSYLFSRDTPQRFRHVLAFPARTE